MHRFISTVVTIVVVTAVAGLWPARGQAQGQEIIRFREAAAATPRA